MEVRHKETEHNEAKGKSLQEQVGQRCEWKCNTKSENESEKDIGRVKVRQRDGKCSGEKGYLCLSVVGTAGCLLKGSQV